MTVSVTEALYARISTRAFLPQPVARELLNEILDAARWSPSGGNLQGWKVIAVTGEARQAVIGTGLAALLENAPGSDGGHPVYPANLWEPYRSRRFQVGEDMYEKLGIPRDDKPARLAHLARNFQFFDAPVGLFFVIDKGMGVGQWAHLGMFMQSVALAATERGVASCFQEAWGQVRVPLAAHFGLPDNEMVYCGMALGYADPAAPVNSLRSRREEVDAFTEFQGW